MKRVEFAWLKVERSEGRSFSASPTLTSPWAVRSSALTEVMGTLDSRLGLRMREPVTTMFAFAGCWAAAGWSVQVPASRCACVQGVPSAFCANAGVANTIDTPKSAAELIALVLSRPNLVISDSPP